MKHHPVLPDHEELRRAFAWLIEQSDFSARSIEEAAVRFDLSPADEEFLTQHFLNRKAGDRENPG